MDHQHDVEAVPPLPQEHRAPAAEDERRRPFSKPRRAVLAVVSVVLVAAIATGVAVAVRPKNGQASADPAGALQATAGAVDAPHAGTPHTPDEGSVHPEAPADEAAGPNGAVAEESSELPSIGSTPDTPSNEIVDGTPLADEGVNVHESAAGPSEISISTPDTSANVDDPASSELPSGADVNESADTPSEGDISVVTPETTNLEAFDNEGIDIVTELVYEAAFPDDVIFDGGYEQQEPEVAPPIITAADKVPVGSEEASLELVEFAGPVTDFIVTSELSRFALSAASRCANPDEGLWKMALQTDNYPWETSWAMVDRNGATVASGPPKGRNYARSTKYIGQMCVKAGRYDLTLSDRNGDGFCCDYGRGAMTVEVNGKTVAQTDDADFSEQKYRVRVRPSPAGTPPPTVRAPRPPTPRPTRRPVGPPPTPRPTRPPQATVVQNQLRQVDVTFATDRFGTETSYTFTRISDGEELLARDDLQASTTSVDSVVVAAGDYRLTVVDKFQGLVRPAYYSVAVDGEEVVYGGPFGGGSASHVVKVGFEPQMTEREREWLDEHNARRREFYAAEGVPFKGLVWSRELAAASSAWVDEITPTCRITREPSLDEGENISARSVGACNGPNCTDRDEGPNAILTRWVDNKEDKGYPTNQSATQVWWRGTRYVGCSEKAVQYGPNSGTRGFVTICRYSRAGNCGMGQYPDWKTATLTERTPCGPICPAVGCY